MVDDDVLYVGPYGTLAMKDDDLDAIRSGRQVVTRVGERELRSRVVGTTGLTWSMLDIEGSIGGQAVVATVRYTRAWSQQDDGGWRVVAAHATVVGPAPA